MKQAIILRTDLGMGKGKLVAQGAHASLSSLQKVKKMARKFWEYSGQKKIVLRVSSEKELLDLFNKAKSKKIPCALIRDAGHTQLKPGTITALGIGPLEDKKVDELVSHLKLL